MISLYPEAPGSKTEGPSAQAAAAVDSEARRLRQLCFTAVQQRDMTADECAAILGQSILSIRPRFSELKAQGLIRDSGVRHKNQSGHSATVWTAKPPA
jgi:predicted ArsR family transcriptional regulator